LQTLIFPRTRRTINETADALLAINNDIVDISKLDVGHLTMEPRQFDLNSFFHNSVE
jgi:signal transduction histidine kinase